jgi:hypothetical protein
MADKPTEWTEPLIRAAAADGNDWLAEAVAYADAVRANGVESCEDIYNELTSGQCEFAKLMLTAEDVP